MVPERKIIHIDMDCFYAAIEVRDRPELRGQPVGVGGSPDSRGVLTTASYEARKFGVRSAMPTALALRKCPQLVLLPPNFDKYRAESQKIRKIFFDYTDKVEPLSLDEAYLDVTGQPHCQGSATLMAREIRKRIFDETKLTASAGIGPNKFIAKIASDWNKPNGQKVIPPEEVPEFIKDLPVERIWGVGKVTAAKLHQLGYHTCGELQVLSLLEMKRLFGKWGLELYQYARGIDHRPVESEWRRKSLSVETTFSQDLSEWDDLVDESLELYEDLISRLRSKGLENQIGGAFVKVKYFDFQQTTHEVAGNHVPELDDFKSLVRSVHQKRSDPIRLLGFGVRMCSEDEWLWRQQQMSLF